MKTCSSIYTHKSGKGGLPVILAVYHADHLVCKGLSVTSDHRRLREHARSHHHTAPAATTPSHTPASYALQVASEETLLLAT